MNHGKPTRRLLAAYLLHHEPEIDDDALGAALGAMFRDDRLARSDASRYRQLWQIGKLPPPPSSDPRTW